jgi:hypothetical protein
MRFSNKDTAIGTALKVTLSFHAAIVLAQPDRWTRESNSDPIITIGKGDCSTKGNDSFELLRFTFDVNGVVHSKRHGVYRR